MNFNFGFSRNFGVPPNFRNFSTGPIVKIDNILTKNGLNLLNEPIISNKSFSNPNFVNKNNPNILAPSCDIKKDDTNVSSQNNYKKPQVEEVKMIPKGNRKNKRKNQKNKTDRALKGKKTKKQWHKTNLDYEISELSESLESDTEPPICIAITSTSSPINITKPNLESPMSISPCCHELMKSLSVKSDSCSPVIKRLRMPSECGSEDSFIVFEESSDEESESMESDSDFEDEESDSEVEFSEECDSRIQKRVSFKNDDELCEVHPMIQWGYAYQQARVGPWEQYARDRARFETRIKNNEDTISKILSPKHREQIYKTRFENLEL